MKLKVKPLVWVDRVGDEYIASTTTMHGYAVHMRQGKRPVEYYPFPLRGSYSTLAEAKDVINQHHSERVLRQIEPIPSVWQKIKHVFTHLF